LTAPERVHYSYKLEGVDADWVHAGSRRIVNYNNLRQGSYRLVVMAELPGGTPSERSYSFVILPHFYETAWFLVLCLMFVLGAAIAGYRFRLRHIRSRFTLVL